MVIYMHTIHKLNPIYDTSFSRKIVRMIISASGRREGNLILIEQQYFMMSECYLVKFSVLISLLTFIMSINFQNESRTKINDRSFVRINPDNEFLKDLNYVCF